MSGPFPWVTIIGAPAAGAEGPPGPPGPPGADGAAGATGATGTVASPLAKFILDEADAGLVNGIVVHRGLGPDRVPASPQIMDDEMITAGTGYDPAKWTVWNPGSETYVFDALGGLKITPTNDSTIRGIEQAFGVTGDWGFVIKVALGSPVSATNTHFGFALRYSSSYIRLFTVSMTSGQYGLNVFEFSSPSTYTSNPVASNIINANPTNWIYLRVTGTDTATPTNVKMDYSLNGVVWRPFLSGVYPDPISTIGIALYQGDSSIGPAYCQFFRRII